MILKLNNIPISSVTALRGKARKKTGKIVKIELKVICICVERTKEIKGEIIIKQRWL